MYSKVKYASICIAHRHNYYLATWYWVRSRSASGKVDLSTGGVLDF